MRAPSTTHTTRGFAMRHLIYHLLMTAVILTAMSSPTLGQMIGQRLRVETSGGSKVTGTVSTRNPDSFILNVEGGGRKTISFATVKKMEKYMGEGTHKKRGFIIGMGFGSLSTALVFGFAFNALCSAGEMLAAGDPGCGGFAAGSALLGAIGGAVIPGNRSLGPDRQCCRSGYGDGEVGTHKKPSLRPHKEPPWHPSYAPTVF